MADRELGIRISKRSASGGVGGGRHGKFKVNIPHSHVKYNGYVRNRKKK